jgi:hypothetical protein
MPLLKTKALPVSDVPNCESWVNGFGGGACSEAEMALRSSETCRVHTSVYAARRSATAGVRAPRIWPVHSMGWVIVEEVGDRLAG